MRFMVLVKASKASEAGEMPSEELLTAMTAYNEALAEAGILVAGEGLHPTSRAVRVRFDGEERTVRSGPFAPTEEQLAGFWIWELPSMDEAIAWARRCPNPHPEPSEIEIRRIFSAEDFGEALTPELREREDALRQGLPE